MHAVHVDVYLVSAERNWKVTAMRQSKVVETVSGSTILPLLHYNPESLGGCRGLLCLNCWLTAVL